MPNDVPNEVPNNVPIPSHLIPEPYEQVGKCLVGFPSGLGPDWLGRGPGKIRPSSVNYTI